MNDDSDIDYEGLAVARWLRILEAVSNALNDAITTERTRLLLALEMELGLRSVLDVARGQEEPISASDCIDLLVQFADANPEHLHAVVPRLERALATLPEQWLAYVQATGRACFDPTELAGACAIAKDAAAVNDRVQPRINALMAWAIDSVIGPRPLPAVRHARFHEHPTLVLDIIREVAKIEINWASLGLTPVINQAMVVRWDAHERWTAFIKMASVHTGEISRSRALRIRSDGDWVVLRT